MSANAFGSDWAQLEAGTFRFRDPLNKECRFIPLRLDDAPIKGSLAYESSMPRFSDEERFVLLAMHQTLVERGLCLRHVRDVERLWHYVCPQCGTPVENRAVAKKRLNAWLQSRPPEPDAASWFKFRKAKEELPSIVCVECIKQVPLWDEMEQCFASPEIQQRVRDMQEESNIELDNESKESALVGEVISTVALAAQISREFNVSDHGIDMEIEFKDDAYEATGAEALPATQVRRFLPARTEERRRGNLHDQG
jgi:hypothetical protein